MNVSKKLISAAAVTALLGAGSANAGGFFADLGQTLGILTPGQAQQLDDMHRDLKERVPAYGAIESAGSRAVREGIREGARAYVGTPGVMLGDMAMRQHQERLEAQRRQAQVDAQRRQTQSAPQYQTRPYTAPSYGSGYGQPSYGAGYSGYSGYGSGYAQPGYGRGYGQPGTGYAHSQPGYARAYGYAENNRHGGGGVPGHGFRSQERQIWGR